MIRYFLKTLLAVCAVSTPHLAVGGDVYLDMAVAFQDETAMTDDEKGNPFGVVRLRYVPTAGGIEIFAQHTSSVPRVNDGRGLNLYGFQWSFSLK